MITNTALTAVPTFNAALDAFIKALQVRIDENHKDYPQFAPHITAEKGRKFVRIVSNGHNGSRSCFCFVDFATGDVLKSDGWKRPAKGVRGSIYVNAGQDAVGVYGANYIRR
jgi:hypothetical protein